MAFIKDIFFELTHPMYLLTPLSHEYQKKSNNFYSKFQKKTPKEKEAPVEVIAPSNQVIPAFNEPAPTPASQEPIDLITKDIFEDVLEKQFGKCSITDFQVKESSGGGENYMSCMFRVHIEVEKEGKIGNI